MTLHPALRTIGLALPLLALPLAASAGTDTGTLSVTATVQNACALGTSTMPFGTYQSGQSTNLDVTGQISYTNCTASNSEFYKVELDGGQSNNVSARKMNNGSNELSYQLYTTSARTTVIGTGSAALSFQVLATGNGSVPIYGRIPSGQIVPAGSYSDVVNVTFTFP
jgi:spore coat protein U-like protein